MYLDGVLRKERKRQTTQDISKLEAVFDGRIPGTKYLSPLPVVVMRRCVVRSSRGSSKLSQACKRWRQESNNLPLRKSTSERTLSLLASGCRRRAGGTPGSLSGWPTAAGAIILAPLSAGKPKDSKSQLLNLRDGAQTHEHHLLLLRPWFNVIDAPYSDYLQLPSHQLPDSGCQSTDLSAFPPTYDQQS